MSLAEYQLLRESAYLIATALVVGLAIHWWIKVRRGPLSAQLREREERGPSATPGPILDHPTDLFFSLAFVGLIVFLVLNHASAHAGSATSTGSSSAGVSSAEGSSKLPWEMLASQFFYAAFFLIPLWFYLETVRRIRPLALFGWNRLSWPRAILWATLLFLAAAGFARLALELSSYWMEDVGMALEEQESVKTLRNSQNWGVEGAMLFSAVIVAPLVEETLFRGMLYGSLRHFTDRPFAMIFSSLLFALAHGHFGLMLPLFVLGVCFAAAYEWTKSIKVPLLMHAFFNLAQACVALSS